MPFPVCSLMSLSVRSSITPPHPLILSVEDFTNKRPCRETKHLNVWKEHSKRSPPEPAEKSKCSGIVSDDRLKTSLDDSKTSFIGFFPFSSPEFDRHAFRLDTRPQSRCTVLCRPRNNGFAIAKIYQPQNRLRHPA